MKYAWVKKNTEQYPVTSMCKVLKISKSGYYDWRNRKPGKREHKKQILQNEVQRFYLRSHGVYGYRKVHEDLVQESKIKCCLESVRLAMRDNGLISKVKKKYVVTTDSNHDYKCADNILNREFTVDRPNSVWVADITYIWTDEGWLYLSGVMDLYGRKIVGWSMSEKIDKQLVIDALKMALTHREITGDLKHHSDRGSQYCSDKYQKILRDNGIMCSMSRKGNCWDNACIESFFGSLKTEWTNDKRYKTRKEAEKDIVLPHLKILMKV